MNQQINLYQPIFREERKLFSLKTAAIALIMVASGLAAIWAVGAHNVSRLDGDIKLLQQQLVAQERMARSAGIMLGAQGNPSDVQAQVQTLSARLAERTRALDLLRNGAAGEPRGFAPRLLAFARQHTDGVWLDHLYLGGQGIGISLQGRSIDADLVPKYLQSLNAEPELVGTRFDEVILDRRERADDKTVVHGNAHSSIKQDPQNSATVRFSVSSRALLNLWRDKQPKQPEHGL